MEHKASCQCGALNVHTTADPDVVVACNCIECQRRTGAPYGVGAYFRKTVASIEGTYKSWSRVAPSGRQLTNHFCPECGTNVAWVLDMRPDHMGVALGCLSTDVGKPARAIWLSEKHDWVEFPEDWPSFDRASPT